jgi:hypothetical protein
VHSVQLGCFVVELRGRDAMEVQFATGRGLGPVWVIVSVQKLLQMLGIEELETSERPVRWGASLLAPTQ